MVRKIQRNMGKLALATAILAVSASNASAQLTVDPTDLYTGVEGGFNAAALIGVAVAGVIFVVRFVKKGLRTA